MENKSTLSNFDWSNQYRRRSGNTTRLVDAGIQIVFDGYICVCEDHYIAGNNRQANKRLFDLIIRRLKTEHNITIFDGIQADHVKYEIWLAPRQNPFDQFEVKIP